MKILIMGLPGAGKTYLAERLSKILGAVHFNADRVRATISTDLGFTPEDRVEHARRLGWMCSIVTQNHELVRVPTRLVSRHQNLFSISVCLVYCTFPNFLRPL